MSFPNLTYDLGGTLAFDARNVFRKSIDTDRLTVTEVLTYPEHDKAGDYVHPDGGNFAPHEQLPWIGLEHYRHHKSQKDTWVYPGDKDDSGEPVVVAWARDSRHEDGGEYSVRMAGLTLKGEMVKLPVATSYFDPADKLSMQVFRMVEDDSLPGVSMEFKPAAPRLDSGRLLKSYRTLGASPIENRPALEIYRWDFYGFVHCRTPVNDGALTVKAIPNDRLIKAVQTGKIGAEPMHPLLLKSFAAAVPSRKYFTAGALEHKAMEDQSLAADSVYDNPEAPEESGGEYPTADALRSLGQALTDACEAARGTKGEHKKGMKVLNKLCDKVEAIVQEAIAAGDNVEDDLSDDESESEVEPTDDEASEVDTSTDEDGVLKCLPQRLKTLFKAKRFTLKEIEQAEKPSSGDSAEDIARLNKARKAFKRAEALHS